MSSKPTVMVSSTCYDLTQIRQDLDGFITNEMGYEPLLSERSSFPIDPDLDTIENCRRRVEEQADVLVLVVGTRYGSIDDDTDKSITNLEYLTAKAKSLPIYTFVDRRILHTLPLWQSSPDADYSAVVDTPRLFEFVDEIRNVDRAWVFPFDTAQDIIATLRIQFAYFVHELMKLNTKLKGNPLGPHLHELGPRSLRLALEKPPHWEYLLLFHAWQEHVDGLSRELNDYRARFAVGTSENVVPEEAADWLQTRTHELQNLVNGINHLMRTELPRAVGQPGEPGDMERIVWAARKFGEVLKATLDWSHRVRRARVHMPYEEPARILSGFTDDLVDELSGFPARNLTKIDEVRAAAPTDSPRTIVMTLTLELSHYERFEAALEEASARYRNNLS